MNECQATNSLSVKEILSKHTVPELISIVKDLNIKGYSGKKKNGIVELLYEKLINIVFLENLFLVCDHRVWKHLLDASTVSSPVTIPAITLQPCKTLAKLGLLQLNEDGSRATIKMPTEIKDAFAQFESNGFLEQKRRSDLLDHYALAVTHLYGIIKQDEFVEIFNAQNSQKTNIDEVFSVLIQHISADAPYGFWGEYLTHSLFEEDDYKDAEDLLHLISGKPRFIPEQSVLLQYANSNFFEQNSASNKFRRYFEENFACSAKKSEEITSEFAFACSVDTSIRKALSILDGYNLPITEEKVREILPLLIDLANHTRKWSNCGYTPEEIHQRSLRSRSVRQGKKIGRNEPCPCGSGKKYKKCCGR